MIIFRNLTARNFLSIGNVTQCVSFDNKDLTLILGENMDLGSGGSRNGTGKTVILNALSYALFGAGISNIRKDNLINTTNGKGMLVSLTFEANGRNYKIERGRRPGVLKFWVDNVEMECTDEAQGDSRDTQNTIESHLGMSHEMFKLIVALNTYSTPFLSQKSSEQRAIIEQLLGVTQLSDKANAIKEQMRSIKEQQQAEDYRIKAINEANKRVEEQISSIRRKATIWDRSREDALVKFREKLATLQEIDIDRELQLHTDIAKYLEQKQSYDMQVTADKKQKEFADAAVKAAESEVDRVKKRTERIASLIEKTRGEIALLVDHTCYACGQDFHDEKQAEVLNGKNAFLAEQVELEGEAKDDAVAADRALEEARQVWPNHVAQYHSKVDEDTGRKWGEKPVHPGDPFYPDVADAYQHRSRVEVLERDIRAKEAEINPYIEQVEEMEAKALQEIDYSRMNELARSYEHHEFLFKLLTSKDSFIRKKIIDQNLSYLNARLSHYLNSVGLPHTVRFLNDLSVDITELGRPLDFDNLSRGERTRLIFSLSAAFRDVWESMYQRINLLMIDELLDNGLDLSGVDGALSLLKHMVRSSNRSVWLISHREELVARSDNIFRVIKENGYTRFEHEVNSGVDEELSE